MAILYHWQQDNYERDVVALAEDADIPFEQSSPAFRDAAPGETLWAFTRRRANSAYVLAASLVIDHVADQGSRSYEYGRYLAIPAPGTTVLYDVERGDDLEPLIRRLPIKAAARVLGSSFQGGSAVRALSAGSEAVLLAFADSQPVLPGWVRRRNRRGSGLVGIGDPFDPAAVADARMKTLELVARRQGQQAFRAALMDAYHGRCAITGCAVVDVLEAAHITPYRGAATDVPTNGLLLRADLHTLYDRGRIAVHEEHLTVLVAPELHTSEYGAIAGRHVTVPARPALQPSALALRAHRIASGL